MHRWLALALFVPLMLPPARAAETRDGTEAALLGLLAQAEDAQEADGIESKLAAAWLHSGSPSADLLMKRSIEALEKHEIDTAYTILQKLTAIAPDFAEAWHMRASVAAQKQDFQEAMLSLRQTLALKPEHFGAYVGLGRILEEFGDKPHALEAYRNALEIHPFLEGIKDHIRELTHEVEGRGI